MPSKRSTSVYPEEDREFALRALALAGGSAARASKALAEVGYTFSPVVLRGFMRKQSRRYAQLREEVGPELKSRRAEAAEAIADEAASVYDTALEKTKQAIEGGELKPNQIAASLLTLATTHGIFRDKASKLRGDETITVVRHERSVEELEAGLRKFGLTVEGTAREVVPDKQLEPGKSE
ncbi:MAG: hypothetical protein ACRDLD_02275 [Thermoleophilaceae bacterium]